MGATELFFHLVHFFAPAFAVAVILALAGQLLGGRYTRAPGIIAQTAINFIAGAVVLGLGLWFFGRDAKMASYAAMLVCCTVSQSPTLRP